MAQKQTRSGGRWACGWGSPIIHHLTTTATKAHELYKGLQVTGFVNDRRCNLASRLGGQREGYGAGYPAVGCQTLKPLSLCHPHTRHCTHQAQSLCILLLIFIALELKGRRKPAVVMDTSGSFKRKPPFKWINFKAFPKLTVIPNFQYPLLPGFARSVSHLLKCAPCSRKDRKTQIKPHMKANKL